MVINLEKIYAMQEKLNNYIFQNTKRNYKNVYHELILALTVELAELANEVKSFKY
jgi:dimeric dUTPase (all-alpha-NTP-PPase superfamily)